MVGQGSEGRYSQNSINEYGSKKVDERLRTLCLPLIFDYDLLIQLASTKLRYKIVCLLIERT